jgi:5'-nucleotidase
MRLRAMLALALAVSGLALGGPASAAHAAAPTGPYPPHTCPTISVSTTHPAVGETITVTGKRFDPGKRVTLILNSRTYVLATATASAQGTFSADVTMPAGLTGNHIISVKGAQSACPADPIQISIQGAPQSGEPGGPGGSPAVTGVDILGLLLAAAALIGLGVLLNRRRGARSRHSHSSS